MIDWNCVRAKFWPDYMDGKRKKMAEVLVPDSVSVDKIEAILCNNNDIKSVIDSLTNQDIQSFVDRKFYF